MPDTASNALYSHCTMLRRLAAKLASSIAGRLQPAIRGPGIPFGTINTAQSAVALRDRCTHDGSDHQQCSSETLMWYPECDAW
jgi:hypothetical protein